MVAELLLDALGVRIRLVDLVHRDEDRHLRGPGMVDRLDGLRHDAVVGRDDEDDEVGHLGAAGAHGGEGLVTRRVEEGHPAPGDVDGVGADVLGDAARLPGGHVGGTDGVEKRRLAVVDMAHQGHHRRAGRPPLRRGTCLLLRLERLLDVEGDVLHLVLEFAGHQRRRVVVEHLVDGGHHAHVEQLLEHLARLDAHRLGQIGDAHHFGDTDHPL